MSGEIEIAGGNAPPMEPTEGQIAHRAYHIWRWLGSPDGYSDAIWARARNELIAEMNGSKRPARVPAPGDAPDEASSAG